MQTESGPPYKATNILSSALISSLSFIYSITLSNTYILLFIYL